MREKNKSTSSKRVDWVDFGKGFTIFLVVLGHVLLGLYQSNRFIPSNNWLWFGTQTVYIFHIPVFFALAGYFFKPVESWLDYTDFVKKKTISLGVPYLFYNILQFVLQQLGGDTVRDAASFSDLLLIYRQPLGVSWFIYVLWGIFIFYGALSVVIKDKDRLFEISLLMLLIVSIFPSELMIIQRVGLWAPIFFLGRLWKERPIEGTWKKLVILGVLIIGYLMMWAYFDFDNRISYYLPRYWGIIFFLVVPFAFMIYQRLPENALFTYFQNLGKDSIVIYLLHAQIVSVTRIVLLKLGLTNVFLHLLLGLGAGWFGSILALKLFRQVPYLDIIFYPQRYIGKKYNRK